MALTDCPACNKKISDKSQECPHCQFKVGDASSEDILRKQNLNMYKKKHRIQNHSLLAVLLFVTGFGFMYWGGTQPGELQHNLAIIATVIGFLWYVVNRVRLVIIKRFSS
ncbi:hypothetical protein [Alteromonas sp. C1M14]|uniref:hypothetical protein n=1 Tax=Alteromonas sp. C1M14 TaxID=2841567 RepID=UPI001C093B39|nr:hypothetical protein [Alteromonas sp. C1M14]MBU2977036.1 hypothetical protein [Alteromonas sp. C1M14]